MIKEIIRHGPLEGTVSFLVKSPGDWIIVPKTSNLTCSTCCQKTWQNLIWSKSKLTHDPTCFLQLNPSHLTDLWLDPLFTQFIYTYTHIMNQPSKCHLSITLFVMKKWTFFLYKWGRKKEAYHCCCCFPSEKEAYYCCCCFPSLLLSFRVSVNVLWDVNYKNLA